MSPRRVALGLYLAIVPCLLHPSPAFADGPKRELERLECGGPEKLADIERKLVDYEIYRSNLTSLGSVLLEGAWLKLRTGVTNHSGDSTTAAGVSTDLDRTVSDTGADIGWYGRPVLRDLLLHNSEEFRRDYACWVARKRDHELRRPDDWVYWGVVEAIRVDATFGYGTLVDDPQGDLNAKTDTGTRYTLMLRWEIPLASGAGWNPFD